MAFKLLKTDAKGRISLGQAFSRVPVEIEARGEGEWMVRLVETIPAREMWLMKNKAALNLVTKGIMHTRNHEFAEDPRKGRNYSWLENVDEEDV
jgi:hypothetical protein